MVCFIYAKHWVPQILVGITLILNKALLKTSEPHAVISPYPILQTNNLKMSNKIPQFVGWREEEGLDSKPGLFICVFRVQIHNQTMGTWWILAVITFILSSLALILP